MAHFVFKYDGSLYLTIEDAAVNTESSMSLPGSAVMIRGQLTNGNTVRRLENFANATAPSAPIRGQLWYDTTRDTMAVFDGIGWDYAFTRITINNKMVLAGDLRGNITLDGINNSSIATTLAPTGTPAGIYTKFTVNDKGVVTSASRLTASDIIAALGFTPLRAEDLPTQSLPTLPQMSIMLWRIGEPIPTGFLPCDGGTYTMGQATITTPNMTAPQAGLQFILQASA